jgi:hypothetical protein
VASASCEGLGQAGDGRKSNKTVSSQVLRISSQAIPSPNPDQGPSIRLTMKANSVTFRALSSPRFRTILQPTLQPIKHVHEPFVGGRIEAADRIQSGIDGRLEFPKRDKVERDDLVRVRFGWM